MNIREWTLPIYTILTQLSVGTLFLIWVIRALGRMKWGAEKVDQSIKIPLFIILTTIIFAIGFAHFHLSRPYLSFLALRNLQSSWLSRELLANLLYIISVIILLYILWFVKGHQRLKTILGWMAVLFGFATDYCMSRIYLLPSQPAWNTLLTPISFLLTTFLLGVVTIPVLMMMDLIFKRSQEQDNQALHAQFIEASLGWLAAAASFLCILMVIVISFQIGALFSGSTAAQTSLRLLTDIYEPLVLLRLVLLFVAVGWYVATALQLRQKKVSVGKLLPHVFAVCLLVMVAEILGRFLFYAIHVRIGI